jgi:hypothetical protein
MFATLVLEREPLKLQDLPASMHTWLLAAGSFAGVGLVMWLALYLARMGERGRRISPWALFGRLPLVLIGGAVLLFVPAALQILWNYQGWYNPAQPPSGAWSQPLRQELTLPARQLGLEYLAACAVMAALLPVLLNAPRLRMRRVWALARLSFKEALRRRVLWGFSALLLVFLFGSWFIPYKAEDQVRNYVRVVYWAMTPLLLVTACLLASFSIPSDLKSQTMFTIVTKPVERFEIILGRFLGYMVLMTLVLLVMNVVSLIYVFRGVSPEAADESLKARVPLYGELFVKNGKSVGREWEYRSYITGPPGDDEAIWTFPRLPREFGERTEPVRCEFSFDIFRTTKGEENKGLYCTFAFQTPRWNPRFTDEYRRARDQILSAPDPALVERGRHEQWSGEKTLALLCNGLAETYGYYELPGKEVVDFHTLSIDVPQGLFKPPADADPRTPTTMQVSVRLENRTQYLGVAKHDLYLLDAERPFAPNFMKGGMGLWYQLCLVVGVGLTCSTYLSGVISFVTTMFLFLGGMCIEFIHEVAQGKTPGGGPMESLVRLTTGTHVSLPLDATPVARVVQTGDKAFEWVLARIVNLFPDVDRFDFTSHVAEGFDIGGAQILMTALFLAGYLLPWLILAYYLMRSREVAA